MSSSIPGARRSRLPHLILILIAFLALLAGPVAAQTLDEFRASGVIAERFDGLVELRGDSPPPGARETVEKVNAERRQIYQQRAQAQGVPASEVAKVYASQILQSAPGGTYFRQPDGSFVRK